MDKTSLGDRIKAYEGVSASKLMRRTPVIIRVDGKAFHTFTKKITAEVDDSVNVGFSDLLHKVMMCTTFSMCTEMQNAVVGYTQSDEISIVLRDWDKHETQQWYDGKLQKIVSVSAAMATAYFGHYFRLHFPTLANDYINQLPLFDARAFNVPMDEVNNYMIWRQKDAERNSIQYIARKFFSHKELHKKNNNQIKDMLVNEKSVLWQSYPTWQKRGGCVAPMVEQDSERTRFYQDEEIPQFVKDPAYINDLLK